MDSTTTPLIRVSQHQRYASPTAEGRSPPYPSRSPASPMSIPNAPREPTVPPPLPPPQHPDIDQDIGPAHHKGWDWFNKDYLNQHYTDFSGRASVKPGSSLLGGKKSGSGSGAGAEGEDDAQDNIIEIDPARRGSSMSTITPAHTGPEHMHESTASSDKDEGKPLNYSKLQGERHLEQTSLSNSSQAYDRNLLSRIGGPNTPNRLSISVHGSDNPAVSPSSESRPEHSRHLSTSSATDRRHPSFDGSHRWSSSMAAPLTASPGSIRNPGLDLENTRPSAHRHPSFPFDDNLHRVSYDHAMFMNGGMSMEEGQMKDLNINDRSPSRSDELIPKSGVKRRASSPHRESARDERLSISSAPGGSDFYTRRSLQQIPSRNSSISKYMPSHGSVSSASSYGPRNGSMASSYGLSVASSATTYTSSRLSPGAISPAMEPDSGSNPYANIKPLPPSPGPLAGLASQQQPTNETTPTLPSHHAMEMPPQLRQNSIPNGIQNAQGMLMCECCPKKPKKFNTQEELRSHLMEKQYTCQYCPNRFKNKNEAERHQNSLHLRKHSWSCAALPSIENVFHPSTNNNNGATDVCGFCGGEFANPADWAKRRDHVCHEHKFGECNQAKKFFRADHFRQHLKHSHGGLSGKWTNMLESVCMRDEPLPQTMAERASRMVAVGNVPGMGMPPSMSMLGSQNPMAALSSQQSDLLTGNGHISGGSNHNGET